MIELHAIFSGQVQGVGFRYTTQNYARKMGLKGTVKNLPDGKVELFAQGTKENLQRLLHFLSKEAFPKITISYEIFYTEPSQVFNEFIILK